MQRIRFGSLVVAVGLLLAGCGGSTGDFAPDLGGEATLHDLTVDAFGRPVPGLSTDQRRLFERGDSFFTQNWVTAPASTDARDGLGPTLNAQACASCHVRDGRGVPPSSLDEGARGLLFRLSVPGLDSLVGGPIPDPDYGGQLQDRSILGVSAEGRMGVSYEPVTGSFGDGTPFELRAPTYTVEDPAFGVMRDDVRIGPRLAPPVFGVGLLEAVPADVIVELADPDDADGDGISGRVNWVWDARADQVAVGRFGWKANVATVEQQVAGAFVGDIGITSSLHPDENCPAVQTDCAAAPDGGSPELTDDRLAAVTFYNQHLAVPTARVDDTDMDAGAEVFGDLGCASCHLPDLTTGPTTVATLSEQDIHPYTDLLVHDMGPGLADGRPDFGASGSEWRTAPLWGIGLVDDVNGERFLLHDGRARSFAEAILWHGGEAESSREAYRLSDAETRAVLDAFLEGL